MKKAWRPFITNLSLIDPTACNTGMMAEYYALANQTEEGVTIPP